MNNSTRRLAQELLLIHSPQEKAAAVRQHLVPALTIDAAAVIGEVPGIPGRSERPLLVHPSQLKARAVGTREGRASLIHALTHIEANAVNLALDVIWRFDGMPERFYLDWLRVAREEALHFQLLRAHLNEIGFDYGDFPAHDGLWEMAEKTKGDLLARLALVPRTLEARGLDASPAIKNKLVSVGDRQGADILDIILRDEIGHVAIGNRWYRHLCNLKGLDPVGTYAALSEAYGAKALKGPFNLEARRAAGFDEAELAQLCA
ncbi:ferritin-like domain-containing protein [Rhodoferax sp.]|uniref:ferritin-like domain-containing protein n=1 Tax=Rhodoferax sp. TaxID=50421 RepID=UPI0027210954|nr:ferritin-like domain-containing protein [Rhodoferax sp.]MDO9196908.1 ferritin-like domain-containing protein [Rhodoferax sp.]